MNQDENEEGATGRKEKDDGGEREKDDKDRKIEIKRIRSKEKKN